LLQCIARQQPPIEYKGFVINATSDAHSSNLKKTVDDFQKDQKQTFMDAERACCAML
jgi:hypothetical protein